MFDWLKSFLWWFGNGIQNLRFYFPYVWNDSNDEISIIFWLSIKLQKMGKSNDDLDNLLKVLESSQCFNEVYQQLGTPSMSLDGSIDWSTVLDDNLFRQQIINCLKQKHFLSIFLLKEVFKKLEDMLNEKFNYEKLENKQK